jgi:hypothetical protein
MAEAAVLTWEFEEIVADYGEPLLPAAISVAELKADERIRLETAQFIGLVATQEAVVMPEQSTETYSLMDAIHEAAEGDQAARKLIETNIRTDMIERTMKSGHVSRVDLDVDASGHIMQYGQTTAQIQVNSLRHASQSWQMQERMQAETRNKFRIDEAYQQGQLEDYAFVVISRAADNMDEAQLEKEGFFTETMSWTIQTTTMKDGQLTLESAFVAGKKTWDAERTDDQAVTRLGQALGVDYAGKSATETLDMPLLVPKELMPNGVVDLVKLAEDHDTFFGENRPRQDYVAYKEQCRQREARLNDRVQRAADELIGEAATIRTPRQATERLGKLSALQMVEQAVVDNSIDARVFGVEAAYRIEAARHYYEAGDMERMLQATQAAKVRETSSSCPGGGGGEQNSASTAGESGKGSKSNSSDLEDCDFVSKECPKCHKKNVKTTVRKGKYYGACGCVG